MEQQHKHTPGPWHVGVADWDDDGDVRYSLVGIKQVCINDAHLIAAAPCLLEALEEALKTLEDTAWNTVKGRDTIRTARAAIARATGETR